VTPYNTTELQTGGQRRTGGTNVTWNDKFRRRSTRP